MDTKYMSKGDRKAAKRAARRVRKSILASFTPKELKAYKKGGKGLRVYAETIGKNQARPEKPVVAKEEAQS